MGNENKFSGYVILPPSPSKRMDRHRVKNAVNKTNVEGSFYLLGGFENERYPIMRKELADRVGEERIIDLENEGNYAIVFNEAMNYIKDVDSFAVSTNPLGIKRHQAYLDSAKREGLIDKNVEINGLNNWREYIINPLIAPFELFALRKDKEFFSGSFSAGFEEKCGYKRPTIAGKDPRNYVG